MQEGIFIAASAGIKQSKKLEVIANNLANVNTTGYKRDRLAFKELMPPFPPDSGLEGVKKLLLSPDKSNKNVSYVAITDKYTDHKSGELKQTNSPLNMGINGEGFFSIQTQDGIRYTRNGNFRLDTANRIVNQKGETLLNEQNEPIVINAQGGDISIDRQGNIFTGNGQGNNVVGKIKLVKFKENKSLEKIGDGQYKQKDPKNIEIPSKATIQQGFLEDSNVSTVEEMTTMMATLRVFETYQKVIQSIDSMDDQAVNNIGRVG